MKNQILFDIFPNMQNIQLYLLTFARLIILFVFAYSSFGKFRDFDAFSRAVLNFRLIPKSIARFASGLFLSSELIIVLLMLIGGAYLISGYLLSIVLLLIFTLALLLVLARGIHTTCNCFGQQSKKVSIYDVIRNVGFILISIIGIFLQPFSILGLASMNVNELALVGIIAAFFVTAWLNLDEIVSILIPFVRTRSV